MKIFLICSKAFYSKLENIRKELQLLGHQITMPNCYDCPKTEDFYRNTEKHAEWKAGMIRHSEEVIKEVDAVLVLNFDKNGQKNYIGGATFLEVYDAFRFSKKIFFINPLPEGILHDELIGFSPIILNGDLSKVR